MDRTAIRSDSQSWNEFGAFPKLPELRGESPACELNPPENCASPIRLPDGDAELTDKSMLSSISAATVASSCLDLMRPGGVSVPANSSRILATRGGLACRPVRTDGGVTGFPLAIGALYRLPHLLVLFFLSSPALLVPSLLCVASPSQRPCFRPSPREYSIPVETLARLDMTREPKSGRVHPILRAQRVIALGRINVTNASDHRKSPRQGASSGAAVDSSSGYSAFFP